jgi:hypothetical protein
MTIRIKLIVEPSPVGAKIFVAPGFNPEWIKEIVFPVHG